MTAELQTIFTIGVYGSTEESFFGALVENEIELFIDIRARRGMRGAKYRYANSSYLQAKLHTLGIAYAHLVALAPSKRMRTLQQKVDKADRTAKRQRATLSKEFIRAYRRDVLKVFKRKPERKFYAKELIPVAKGLAEYPLDRPLRHIAFFCVEQHPSACHRSLVADEWNRQQDVKVVHLMA